jgi:hypothetical protein
VWEPLYEGVAWRSPPLFNLRLSRAAIVAVLGEPDLTNLDSNGVGLFDAWALRFSCGLEVMIWIFHTRPERQWEEITDPRELANVEIHASERDFDHIRHHFPLPMTDLSRWEPDTMVESPRDWLVVRQDDNGNRYEMSAFSSECEARDSARTFEERGHKQMYWVERRNRGATGDSAG